jgi:hypothetical protein
MPSQYKIVIVVEQTEQQRDEWGSPFKWDFGEWTPAREGGCTDISYDIYKHDKECLLTRLAMCSSMLLKILSQSIVETVVRMGL